MLYRSTDRLCRRWRFHEELAHIASFDSDDKNAPSKPGIKHLAKLAGARGHFIVAGTPGQVAVSSRTLKPLVLSHMY